MISQMAVRIKFVPRDFWLGVFVGKPEFRAKINTDTLTLNASGHVGVLPVTNSLYWTERKVYICIIPMLPIILIWRSNRRGEGNVDLDGAERAADVSLELQGGETV